MNEQRRALVLGITAAGITGLGPVARAASAEPPPETTRIRLTKVPSACLAPQYLAEELLRVEGFTQIEYIGGAAGGIPDATRMGAGEVDIGMNFAAPLVVALDAGSPIVVLAGVHAGCFELFANANVGTISDLKGKTVSIVATNSAQHVFLASIATSVGVSPRDIRWVANPPAEGKRLLAEGGIDAYLGFPPDPQELRAKKVGRVMLNSATDRPWSQYFCCMVAANRDWVTRHPIAARRALRAILKGSELCATDPDAGARAFLGQGFAFDAGYARQALRELPFGKWREFNPEETLRFYALRLREAEMVKGAPQKLIAGGADWRILDQLRREMKS